MAGDAMIRAQRQQREHLRGFVTAPARRPPVWVGTAVTDSSGVAEILMGTPATDVAWELERVVIDVASTATPSYRLHVGGQDGDDDPTTVRDGTDAAFNVADMFQPVYVRNGEQVRHRVTGADASVRFVVAVQYVIVHPVHVVF